MLGSDNAALPAEAVLLCVDAAAAAVCCDCPWVTVRLLAERLCAAALEEVGADRVALDSRGCCFAVSELGG